MRRCSSSPREIAGRCHVYRIRRHEKCAFSSRELVPLSRALSSKGGEAGDAEMKKKNVPIPPKTRSRKGVREKKAPRPDLVDGKVCAAYSTTNEISLPRLHEALLNYDLTDSRSFDSYDLDDVAGCTIKSNQDKFGATGYAFFFSSGSMVFWDVPLSVQKKVFSLAR